MGLAVLRSRAIAGVQAPEVTVEVHLANGLPTFSITGTIDPERGGTVPMNAKPKAYSYLRFSTSAQQAGDSFRRQSTLAQQYALRYDLDLDESLTFHDLGVSAYRGANAEAGRLAEFREAVQTGLVPVGSFLLVEALDRISRLTPRKALRVLEDIVELGVTVVTLNDEKQYSVDNLNNNHLDLIMAILHFTRANEESATKGRRLKAAWEGKRETASEKPLTANTPAWISLDKATGLLKLDEKKAQIVKGIFDQLAAGTGLEAIARTLNQRGISPIGKAGMWRRTYIKRIRDNPAVTGTFIPHKIEYTSSGRRRVPQEPIQNYFPPIICEEVFYSVQAMAKSRAPLVRQDKGIQSMLAGLAKCPQCAGAMTRVSKTKGSTAYLVCAAAKAGAGCEYRSVRLDQIEQTLWFNLDGLVSNPPFPDESDEADRQNNINALAAIEDSIENIIEAISKRPLPRLIKELEVLQAEQQKLSEELQRLDELALLGSFKLVLSRADDLRKSLSEAKPNLERVNARLRQLFSKVIVDYRSGMLEFYWQHGGTSELMFAWVE